MKLLLPLLLASCAFASNPNSIEPIPNSVVGSWVSIGGEMNGVEVGKNFGKTFMKFDAEKFKLNGGQAVKYTIDENKSPTWIDFHSKPKQVGIIKFVNGNLHLCIGKEGDRPAEFKSDAGDDYAYLVMRKKS